jgi:uncharacterized protein YkwD
MTLAATRKRPTHHKKLSGKHHRQDKAYHKAYWPYLPIIAVILAGFFLNNISLLPGRHAVLGYATDMSISGLLSGTNTQRLNNGETALALNGLLDNAAQAKANDMAARDYWSHNTPDGQTPWSFMTAAGYSYQLAGENLAYGFTTSSDTITGWMNSPGHRANILNSGYTEVGFGIINIANYQGTGPETLVVAMYGTPANVAPAPVASAPTPTPQASVKSSQPSNAPVSSGSDAAGGSSQPDQQTDTSQQPSTAGPTSGSDTVTPTSTPLKDVAEPKQEHVSRSQILTAGSAPWSELVLSLLGLAGILIVLLRHGLAWHRLLRRGERFVLHHPWTDTAIVGVVVLVCILIGSAGVIK